MNDVSVCTGVDARVSATRRVGSRGERGSVLVGSLLACLFLMSVVTVVFNSSNTASSSAVVNDSKAESLAAAEFAVNRAVAEMTSWARKDGNSKRDWVYGESGETLYVGPTNIQSPDHRRFSGQYGDQDFRVLVRSAKLAKENVTKPTNWLWEPDKGETLYEVIASARTADFGEQTAARRTEAILQSVMSVKFQDGWSGEKEFGPLYTPLPSNFQPRLETNIILSGEDHDINKYYIEKFESERIVTPLKLTSSTANFLLADGGYWRGGNLTLNYRMEPDGPDANPHRPSTTSFGTGSNRTMYVPYPAKEYDTYLLGGKVHGGQGRTVRVDMSKSSGGVDGEIIETNGNGVSQGGAFNLVLGQFEDLRNLYINMAGLAGGSFLDASKWWQMYVGQYTHLPRNSDYNNSGLKSYPNYGGNRIRAQTAHLMKNKDGHVLVRLFKTSNGKLYAYPESGAAWTGYYCWAPVDISKTPGVRLTRNVTATTTTPGEKSNAQAVARTFFWQELVGYQLARRAEHTVHLDPLNRDTPITGSVTYPNEPAVFTQRDLPADGGQRIDKRTIYRVDGDGNRLPAGFDEIYQADKNAGVPGTPSDSKHPLYGTRYSDISPGYLQDRFDTIYVWEGGKVEAKPDMNAFLFEKDFGNDEDGNPIVRQALALHIGYEDQRESTADFDYCDMVFTIYIAPSVDMQIIPGTMFPLLTDQWWEQNPDNGLTGLPSHPGLVTNKDPVAESFEDSFNALGYSPKTDPSDPSSVGFEEQVYTLRKEDSGEGKVYLRATFETDTGTGALVFVPALGVDNLPLMGPDNPYYYTEDDVNDYLIHEWNRGNKTIATDAGRAAARAAFPGIVPAVYVLKEMPERWDPADVSKPILADEEENSAYAVMKTAESLREIGAEIFGFKYQSVPAVETYLYAPVHYSNGDVAEPEKDKLGFMAGEMVQDAGYDELTPVAGDYIPIRPEKETVQPDGSKTPTLVFLTDDPKDAVDMAYRDFYTDNPDLKKEVQAIYGIKDQRYSIGFHRSGPDAKYDERHSRDRYEVVLMGQLGFNPYRETTDGKYVAKNSETDPNGSDPYSFHYGFKYGNDGLVPDFVFDRPIDGAGILLVNGNLIVEDEFAYYGLVIVMGDLVVRPTYKANRLVYGIDGNPVDAYGNSLFKNQSGEWAYIWQDPTNSDNVKETTYILDDSGNKKKDEITDDFIRVAPLYATGEDAYRGRIITQGNLLVNGRILTESVPNPDKPGEFIIGQIHCYASSAANEMSNNEAQIKKDTVEVLSWSSNTNPVIEEEVRKLWSGEN